MHIDYTVEETPAGTAGSIRLAKDLLDETFLVISGDALTDFDLTKVIDFHKRARGDGHHRAQRAWRTRWSSAWSSWTRRGASSAFWRSRAGARSSPTRSTPASTCSSPRSSTTSPRASPTTSATTCSPSCSRCSKPLYGMVCEGYWQDIGSLEQYLQANRDALDGKIRLTPPGVRLRGNIWVGKGAVDRQPGRRGGPGRHRRERPHRPRGPHPLAHRPGRQHRGADRARRSAAPSWARTSTWPRGPS